MKVWRFFSLFSYHMKQLLITTLCHLQIAVMQGDRLCQLLSDSQHAQTGDIYLAKVVRVLPALSVAFLDIGEDKNALMRLGREQVYQGQWLIVQIVRPAYAQKGATATTAISLSSPYVAYKPLGAGVGVSAKLTKEVSQALKECALEVMTQLGMAGGAVIRTRAQGADRALLRVHFEWLKQIWQDILSTKQDLKIPTRLYRTPLLLTALDDHTDITKVSTDDETLYHEWRDFLAHYLPQVSIHYERGSLFANHHIYTQLQNALTSCVPLSSGAYLVIDVCEAMTVIDVNTGTLTHSSQNLIYETNLQAVLTIASELMLRQIGGLVAIDLIDMKSSHHKDMIYQEFKRVLADDIAKVHLLPINEFGVMMLSRERVSLSFYDKYTATCSTCRGVGKIPTWHVAQLDIVSKLAGMLEKHHPKDDIILQVPKQLYHQLQNNTTYQALSASLQPALRVQVLTEGEANKYSLIQNKHR